jgi:hypothetical protein
MVLHLSLLRGDHASKDTVVSLRGPHRGVGQGRVCFHLVQTHSRVSDHVPMIRQSLLAVLNASIGC